MVIGVVAGVSWFSDYKDPTNMYASGYTNSTQKELKDNYTEYMKEQYGIKNKVTSETLQYFSERGISYKTSDVSKTNKTTGLTYAEMSSIQNKIIKGVAYNYLYNKTGVKEYIKYPLDSDLVKRTGTLKKTLNAVHKYNDTNNSQVSKKGVLEFLDYTVKKDTARQNLTDTKAQKSTYINQALTNLGDTKLKTKLVKLLTQSDELDYTKVVDKLEDEEKSVLVNYLDKEEDKTFSLIETGADNETVYTTVIGLQELKEVTKAF